MIIQVPTILSYAYCLLVLKTVIERVATKQRSDFYQSIINMFQHRQSSCDSLVNTQLMTIDIYNSKSKKKILHVTDGGDL
jgi:hypothetical protein